MPEARKTADQQRPTLSIETPVVAVKNSEISINALPLQPTEIPVQKKDEPKYQSTPVEVKKEITSSQIMNFYNAGLKLINTLQTLKEVSNLQLLKNELNNLKTELLNFQRIGQYSKKEDIQKWIDEIASIKTFLTNQKHPSQLMDIPYNFEKICRVMEYTPQETSVKFKLDKTNPEDLKKLQSISAKLDEINILLYNALKNQPDHKKQINNVLNSMRNRLNLLGSITTQLEFDDKFKGFATGDIVVLTQLIDKSVLIATIKNDVENKLQELYQLAGLEEIKIESYQTLFNGTAHDISQIAPAQIGRIVKPKSTIIGQTDRGFKFNGKVVIKPKIIVAE